MNISGIVRMIKSKEELSGISDDVVVRYVHKCSKEPVSSLNGKDLKLLISSVRAELRKISGSFNKTDGSVSVGERVDVYSILTNLFSSQEINYVLDLGCGLNPIHLAKQGITYYAYDINEKNLAVIRKYFNDHMIKGEVRTYDLSSDNAPFPAVDITLFMKVFDVLEKRGHKLAESLIKRTNSRYILISFPTKTLSGAPMRHPQRGWIERLLKRLGFKFEMFSSRNEIFYLAEK